MILAVVLYVATLMSFTWETMAFTAVGYLLTLPFGMRAWQRKYGDWPHPVKAAAEDPREGRGPET